MPGRRMEIRRSRLAEALDVLRELYDEIGIKAPHGRSRINSRDDFGLTRMLSAHLSEPSVRVVGCAALFSGQV